MCGPTDPGRRAAAAITAALMPGLHADCHYVAHRAAAAPRKRRTRTVDAARLQRTRRDAAAAAAAAAAAVVVVVVVADSEGMLFVEWAA